jgi:hypothetical protein
VLGNNRGREAEPIEERERRPNRRTRNQWEKSAA